MVDQRSDSAFDPWHGRTAERQYISHLSDALARDQTLPSAWLLCTIGRFAGPFLAGAMDRSRLHGR
jgi:hypothetical protein